MNQLPQGLQASKAVAGFLQYKQAEGLSPATVFNYTRELKLWLDFLGDMDIGRITPEHLLDFMNYLRTDYVPRRITGGNDRKLSDKRSITSMSASRPSLPGPAENSKCQTR
jgi:integrase/recombinase XerD